MTLMKLASIFSQIDQSKSGKIVASTPVPLPHLPFVLPPRLVVPPFTLPPGSSNTSPSFGPPRFKLEETAAQNCKPSLSPSRSLREQNVVQNE